MKEKLLIAGTLIIGLTGCSDGLMTTSTTNDLTQPDFNYEIDTWGYNSEVYEFTPKSNPS